MTDAQAKMREQPCMCEICSEGRKLNEMGLTFMERGWKCDAAKLAEYRAAQGAKP